MSNFLTIIKEILPFLISLVSVGVAVYSVRLNRRIAYRQAFYDRKSEAYKTFYAALSTLVYDQYNPAKRAALTHAVYCAMLFASRDAAIELNFVAEWALGAKGYEDISVLDEVLPALRDTLSRDLALTWNRSLDQMYEDLVQNPETSRKTRKSPCDSACQRK